MKKYITIALAALITTFALAGCKTTTNPESTTTAEPGATATAATSTFDSSKTITVISREEGSGTRGAFVELTGVEAKDESGTKVDRTTEEAEISSETNVVITTVAGNDYAIGYISLGSLNDTVKAVKVDGADATVANIKAGTYALARPFMICTKGEATGLKKDFIDFIMSKQGQEVITGSKYIAVDDAAAEYTSSGLTGKLVIGGSSSVTPVMEKLVEAYKALNSGVTLEVQMSDSTTGVSATIEGTLDIGMASRDLKDTEKDQVIGTKIAMDGIAVIVNNNNTIDTLTKEQIMNIYIGEVTKWSEVQ